MGRGQKIDREQLRETILEKATELVNTKGMEQLTIRKISGEIGCAIGTIYNVFSNLDAIILTINAATMTRLYAQLERESNRDNAPMTALISLGQSYVAFSQENFHLWSMLVDHKLAPGNTLPDWFQEKIDALFTLVSRMVAPLVNNDQERAERAARVLWAGLHGVCSLAVSGKLDAVHAEPADVLAESLIRNYLQGLQMKTEKPKIITDSVEKQPA